MIEIALIILQCVTSEDNEKETQEIADAAIDVSPDRNENGDDKVETKDVIQEEQKESVKELLNMDQPLAPTDGPEEGNIEGCALIHEGTKWFWRPNIHLDLQVYVLEKENCYGIRVNWRDEHLELPYLFLDKTLVDTKLDQEFIKNGPKLEPHEALKKQMEGQ